MGTAEIVDIARSVWKAIIIIVLAFAALNFLIQALLRWEKTNKVQELKDYFKIRT
jgi:hypothetical protein